ncbi:hypothetical protein [Streptomyces sp. TRM68416]|uniref:hypothetical protein n=1 Tax=Streptomyces sp. TRM68416 TaxID=2758412 RepID=UPI001661E203|nr:hypothetical protein [Streptomyces sp. TRM68416]MBD0842753.1 hypothetical protein [Streptomyces sp. TRM68416]
MTEQQTGTAPDQARETRRRQAGIAAFLVGLVATLTFFAFFPGLPHVIDWGAILVSLAVGALARWAYRSWTTRTAKKAERM